MELHNKSGQNDDDDDEGFGELYENGHWEWDEQSDGLLYVSDRAPKSIQSVPHVVAKVVTGKVEFRDDVDLIEQQRFRRRYQRKLMPGQADVITLQDVKDIAIFTAPVNILSPMLIQILHLNTTERFIRALIFYCQYYLQISEEMMNRTLELETKIRTPDCKLIESVYRDNLSDLRLLVAKEYGTMLIGGADTKKFHHMGPQKKLQSLSDKDARLFETLLRVIVQIVWLALGRKAFNQIELEMNRLFKTEVFNSVEHSLRTGYINKMGKEEKEVLLGRCMKQSRKLKICSPLMYEVFCHRPVNYQMLGLGVVKYPDSELSERLQYLQRVVSWPEEEIIELEVTVGILGFPRSMFDTMLRPISYDETTSKGVLSKSISKFAKSRMSAAHTSRLAQNCVFPDIILPVDKGTSYSFAGTFSNKTLKMGPCNITQRNRWLSRLVKLLHHK